MIRRLAAALALIVLPPATGRAGPLICAGIVAPGLAYPDPTGHWRGLELTLCDDLARRIGAGRPVFSPILQATDTPPPQAREQVDFLPAGDIPVGFVAGAVIDNDHEAILVPAASPARRAADLAGRPICVEPGSPEEAALEAYFAAHAIRLVEFAFQEVDEMHDAYLAGRCDAVVAPVSLLSGLRANAGARHRGDRLLPDDLADNPIRVATPPRDARLAAILAEDLPKIAGSDRENP